MSETTQAQIDGMRKLCEALKALPEVADASINDWGRYGNFSIFVTPRQADRHTTRRTRSWVSKALKSQNCSAHVRQVFGPDPVTRTPYQGRRRVIGYSRGYWEVDVDFKTYDAASNTFS